MSDLSSATFSSDRSANKSPRSCKYERICKDQQVRLHIALSEVEKMKAINKDLQEKLYKSEQFFNVSEFVDDKSQLLIEIKNLKEKNQILEAKNDVLKNEMFKFKQQYQDVEKTSSILESENRKLTQIIERKKTKIRELKDSVANSRSFNNILGNFGNNFNSNMKNMEFADNVGDLDTMGNARSLVDKYLNPQVPQTIIANEPISEAELTNAKNHINTLEKQLGKANNRILDLETQLSDMRSQVTTLRSSSQNQITRMRSDYDIAMRNANESIEKYSQLEKEFRIMKERNEELKYANDNLTSQVEILSKYKSRSEDLFLQVGDLKSQVEMSSESFAKLKVLEAQVGSLSKTNENLLEENRALRFKLNDHGGRIQLNMVDAKIEKESLLRDITRLEERCSKIRILEAQNAELQIKVDELYQRLKESAGREAGLSANLKLLLNDKEELEGVRKELLSLQNELLENEKHQAESDSQIRFYRAENKDLRQKLLQFTRSPENSSQNFVPGLTKNHSDGKGNFISEETTRTIRRRVRHSNKDCKCQKKKRHYSG